MLNIINGTQTEISKYIREGSKRIYIWGVGVMTQICISQWIMDYDLHDNIIYCTDSALDKIGKKVNIANEIHMINSVEYFIDRLINDKDSILIISCTYFNEILEYLDDMKGLNRKACIIAPLIYLENTINTDDHHIFSIKKQIPKIIHYCWFGNQQLPEKSKKCIESWRRFCPDYKIICWNEDNYDVRKNSWLKKAYENEKWAFVSDYARADILYNYGGVYYDTDVEIIRNIDGLLSLQAFGSFEKWPVLNTGGGSGSIPGFWLWKEIMELRNETVEMDKSDIVRPDASGYFETVPLIRRGLKLDGKLQNVDGFTILQSDYFHPLDYLTREEKRTRNTYSVHYFNWSWSNKLMKNGNPDSKTKCNFYKEVIKRIEKI